jgi:hypothetical protein
MTSSGRRIAMTPRNVVRVAAALVASTVGVTCLGGTAYAYWVASGSGAGAAAAGSAVPQSATAASPTGLLYPGGPAGNARLTITNPNPFPVTVTDVVNPVTGAITSNKGQACDDATGVDFTDVTGAALAVPASSSATFTLTGAVRMDNSSDNSCQGATFTIPVVLTARSG